MRTIFLSGIIHSNLCACSPYQLDSKLQIIVFIMFLLYAAITIFLFFPLMRHWKRSLKFRHLPGFAWFSSLPVVGHAYKLAKVENPRRLFDDARKK